MKAIIIDDEAKSRRILQHLLEEYCEDVDVVGSGNDVLSGIKAVYQHQPDIVFLDIEMPNYSGFKLLETFEEPQFDVVFTTAYEQYAIDAFKVSAIDYLLKPIDIEELIQAVEKIKRKTSNEPNTLELNNRLNIPVIKGMLTVALNEILYLTSDGRYTKIWLNDGSQQTSKISIQKFETMLKGKGFIRIHRSNIINLMHIKRYSKSLDANVEMANDTRLYIGKSFKDNLDELLKFFIR